MVPRPVKQLVRATALSEGGGVRVHRTLGTPALRNLDPFLMLDHFSSNDPNDYIAGFPDHPHRGFITFTYMLDGHLLHQDSMGNRGDLRAGSAQWMKAASGVIHSEMPQQIEGLMRGFQLWINLPAREKMTDPEYQEFPAERMPVVETAGARVKIMIGEYQGKQAPIRDPHTGVQYLDVTLEAQRRFAHPIDPALSSAMLYVFEGGAGVAGTPVPVHSLAVLGAGDGVEIAAGPEGARFILVAGRPLKEPVMQYGPFVMSNEQELRQAVVDYQNNRLVQKKAGVLST